MHEAQGGSLDGHDKGRHSLLVSSPAINVDFICYTCRKTPFAFL